MQRHRDLLIKFGKEAKSAHSAYVKLCSERKELCLLISEQPEPPIYDDNGLLLWQDDDTPILPPKTDDDQTGGIKRSADTEIIALEETGES